jgi:polysaccharide pyruvyl transferase WcaK-like protein
MKVLVLWADDKSANLGVRVLADGAAALARRTWGESTVVDHQDFGSLTIGTQITPRVAAKDFGRRAGAIKAGLQGYDAILDTGAGDSFADIYGLKRLSVMAYVQHAARSIGIPVVLTPQTIGPFTTRRGQAIAKHSLRRAALVMSRDADSTAYAESIGRPVDVTATDVVFALPQPQPAATRGRDIIFNVSGLLWQEGHHVDATHYRASVRGILNRLLAEGRDVTLLAHVLDNPSKDNDLVAIDELQREYGDRVSAVVPTGLEDARAALAGARVVIGSRMHACLNALSVGTPAIPLAYSRKFAPLMSDIGWPHTLDLRTREDVINPVVKLVLSDEWGSSVSGLRSRAEALFDGAVSKLAAIR